MKQSAILLLMCAASLAASDKPLATATVAPVAEVPALTLALKAHANSAGDEVLLSEIVETSALPGQAPAWLNTPVCKAANAGQTRKVYPQEILTALRRNGMTEPLTFTGPGEAKVTALAQQIPTDDVLNTVRNALSAAFEQDTDLETQVEIAGQQPLAAIRPGPFDLGVDLPDAGVRPGVQSVRLRVSQNGRRVTETSVSVRLRVTGTVTVAAERIPANAVIGENDIKTIRKELTAGEMNLRGELTELVGLRAKQSISAGQILQRKMLALPLVMKRGDAVSVIVRRGSLELTATGEARADASLNESVRVFLNDSGAEVIGRASGPREVSLDELRRSGR